jgi:hypothetical protein
MSLFGNDIEAQMGRALFQQDLYTRMFNDYERREDAKSEARFQDWKKENDEFYERVTSLTNSIGETTRDINNFYKQDESLSLNEDGRVFHVMNKLKQFFDEYQLVFNEYISCSTEASKKFLQDTFLPVALKYYKILNVHVLSLQPFILMSKTFKEASKNFYGPIDERITAITQNEDIGPLEFDREGWNNAYNDYDNAKVAWGDANVAIIKNWDPWTETDIHAMLGDYAKVTSAMYRAGNDFVKHLEKVEKLLEKIWEIRKTADLTAQFGGGVKQEPDGFAKIEKLAQLFQSGAITETEFASKKAELLKNIE